MSFDVYMPVRVFSGKQCFVKNADCLLKYGKRCFVLTGKSSAVKSGALSDAADFFEKNNISYQIFDEIEPNPLTSTCKRAGDLSREFCADYILAIGGGSVMDAAKAVAIYMANPDFSHTDIYSRNIPCKHIPVILIGTTAGTGSEVTGVSVLTNSDTGLKKSISGADCYADISFCDFSYTKSAGIQTMITTALDAFCHAVEAYLASSANENVYLYSEYAIKLLSPYIVASGFEDFSDDDFEKVYTASIYAGLAINIAGTDFPHTVGYYLTENFYIPHGKACAVFMPLLMERAKKYCPERFEAIISFIGCDAAALEKAIKSYVNVALPVSAEEIKQVALRWKDGVRNFDRSPGGFSYKDAADALIALIS